MVHQQNRNHGSLQQYQCIPHCHFGDQLYPGPLDLGVDPKKGKERPLASICDASIARAYNVANVDIADIICEHGSPSTYTARR